MVEDTNPLDEVDPTPVMIEAPRGRILRGTLFCREENRVPFSDGVARLSDPGRTAPATPFGAVARKVPGMERSVERSKDFMLETLARVPPISNKIHGAVDTFSLSLSVTWWSCPFIYVHVQHYISTTS